MTETEADTEIYTETIEIEKKTGRNRLTLILMMRLHRQILTYTKTLTKIEKHFEVVKIFLQISICVHYISIYRAFKSNLTI